MSEFANWPEYKKGSFHKGKERPPKGSTSGAAENSYGVPANADTMRGNNKKGPHDGGFSPVGPIVPGFKRPAPFKKGSSNSSSGDAMPQKKVQ